jgi:hypothetical protein
MHTVKLIKGGRIVETHTDDTTVDPAELRRIAERLVSQSETKPDDWVVENEVGRKIVSRNP